MQVCMDAWPSAWCIGGLKFVNLGCKSVWTDDCLVVFANGTTRYSAVKQITYERRPPTALVS